MNQINFVHRLIGIILVSIFCFAILAWGLHAFVTSRTLYGIDFYVYWVATRAMFRNGVSPYSQIVTMEAQFGILGRLAGVSENQHMFLNPPYSLFVLLPTAWLNYPWAFAYWMAFNIVLLMVVLRFSFPGLPAWIVATAPLFYPFARGLIMGQFSLTIGILLLFVHAILFRRHANRGFLLFIPGVLLAWLTIKPQLTWLLIAFYLLYSVKNHLVYVWIGFLTGVLLLGGLSWNWVPGWPRAWLQQGKTHLNVVRRATWVQETMKRFTSIPLADWLGLIILLLVVLITLVTLVRWWQGRFSNLPTLALCALLVFMLNPLTTPPEQIIFLTPLLAWVYDKSKVSILEPCLVWCLGLFSPWIVFLATIDRYEPYSVSIWTPMLFAAWVVWIILRSQENLQFLAPIQEVFKRRE